MLSWKGPSGWCFLFFRTLPSPFTVADLEHPDAAAIGISILKEGFVQRRPWRHLTWRDQSGCEFRAAHPFRIPPASIRDDILAFARQHGVFIKIAPPNDKST